MERQLSIIDQKANEAMRLDSEASILYEEAIGLLDVVLRSFSPNSPEFSTFNVHRQSMQDRLDTIRVAMANGTTADQVHLHGQMNNSASEVFNPTTGSKVAIGAAAVGGLGGLILLGPLGLLVGGTAAAYMSMQQGSGGDAVRKVGETAVHTGARVKELEQEHHLLEKGKTAITNTYHAGQRLNEEYKITERVSTAASAAWEKTKELEEKHNITGKIAQGVSTGLQKIGDAMKSLSEKK